MQLLLGQHLPPTCSQWQGFARASGRFHTAPGWLWRPIYSGTCRLTFRDGFLTFSPTAAASASDTLNEHLLYLKSTESVQWQLCSGLATLSSPTRPLILCPFTVPSPTKAKSHFILWLILCGIICDLREVQQTVNSITSNTMEEMQQKGTR